ncbi:MAG: hypothetical protein LBG57_14410 [Treponema sp.]|jgi:hypothetical protein|nr:hypothetical protein [Treponema sp.]
MKKKERITQTKKITGRSVERAAAPDSIAFSLVSVDFTDVSKNFRRKVRGFFSLSSVLAICLAAAGFVPLNGLDMPISRISDDTSLRISLKESLITEVPGKVMGKRPVIYNLDGGGRVELRVETGRDEFTIILAREQFSGRVDDISGGAVSRNSTGSFPGWAQGSWILTRRKDTGEPTRIRVFLRSDPWMYVQFRPLSADKCQMDAVLYEAYVTRSLPLPVPFERLYTMPLAELLSLAGDKFPGRYFEPDPALYRDQRRFIANVRKRLPEVVFADDGAIDEEGNYVFIETLQAQSANNAGLNCSGFAKWLADGLLRPITGKRLAIPSLKARFGERGSSFTELWEDLRQPFFGLDWVRNLAAAVWTTLRSPAYGGLAEFEVRSEPFSQVIVRSGGTASTRLYPGFLENAGYGFEGIHPLLYTLAVDDPGSFYMAAVNTEMGPPATEENPRGLPRMRQYFHIAALVPYFNEYGEFRVTVFESAEETSFNAFKTRYPGHYVNLVRLPVETVFDP